MIVLDASVVVELLTNGGLAFLDLVKPAKYALYDRVAGEAS